MKGSETKVMQVVSSTRVAIAQGSVPGELVSKMKRAWTPRATTKTYDVNHFLTLSLKTAAEEDGEDLPESVNYHKDQWNERDYSHEDDQWRFRYDWHSASERPVMRIAVMEAEEGVVWSALATFNTSLWTPLWTLCVQDF